MSGAAPPAVGTFDEVQVANIEVRTQASSGSPRSDSAIIQRRDGVPMNSADFSAGCLN